MAFLLDVTFQDVNNKQSTSSMWIATKEDATDVITALKSASNAKIARATISTPIPLTTVINNDATAANVETATSKALIAMRGADAGSSGVPFAHVHVGIPAPIGTLINGLSGDTSNVDANLLKDKVLSKTGVQMDVVESIKYSR